MIHLTIKVPTLGSYNPGPASGPGLGCSLFARRYWGNRILFLFLRLLRCFNSAGIASQSLCVQLRNNSRLGLMGFPIRKSPGQSVFAATRGLSQLATSFIALHHQGIHQLPLLHFGFS